ncbi:MAG TPA: hypothetical protein VKQ30_00035 [Ktedonobacterales bacterium]|nr:hypothetical protein [Ktedonobacterales bacterium]
MASLRPAVAVIERAVPTSWKPRKRGNLVTWVWICIGIFGVLMYVACVGYSASLLLAAWRSGDSLSWSLFWHNPFYILSVYPAALLPRKDMLSNSLAHWGRLAAARKAALEGDSAHVPLAAPQPIPDADDTPAITRRTVTPLIRPSRIRDSAVFAVAITLFVCAFMLAITVITLFFSWISTSPEVGPAVLILLGITVCCLAGGNAALHRCRRTHKPVSVTVDGQGLHWRESTGCHRIRHIAWSQAQAFMTFSWRSHSTYTAYQIFALIAPHAVFTWELTQRSSRDEKQAHEKLAGLIATRTGLPLRDLTVSFNDAIAPLPVPAKPKIRFPLGSPGTPDAVPGIPALIAAPDTIDATRTRRRIRLGALVAIISVPLILLDGAGFYLQREQPHYFAAYLARAEAQSPLYLDALNEDDGQWPVQPATTSNPGTYFFTEDAPLHGVYQLSGADPQYHMYAWQSQSFSDATVEVTARYPKNAPSNVAGAVGLLLRQRGDGDQFVEFQVDTTGRWEFLDYAASRGSTNDWRFIDDGYSSAIHPGMDAINRVAVLMHGNDFILYVNGVFLRVETDSSAPTSGTAGVYVANDMPGGQFADFAVYPLPADPPLLWG